MYFDPYVAASVPADARWTYDDPSGIAEEVPLTLHVPDVLLDELNAAAGLRGTTPAAWLLDLLERSLRHPGPAAA